VRIELHFLCVGSEKLKGAYVSPNNGPNAAANATGYAMRNRRSADAVIRVYDEGGNVIETHQHAGDFSH